MTHSMSYDNKTDYDELCKLMAKNMEDLMYSGYKVFNTSVTVEQNEDGINAERLTYRGVIFYGFGK